jgi:hypothetical protein
MTNLELIATEEAKLVSPESTRATLKILLKFLLQHQLDLTLIQALKLGQPSEKSKILFASLVMKHVSPVRALSTPGASHVTNPKIWSFSRVAVSVKVASTIPM